MRPGGLLQDAPPEFWERLKIFTSEMPGYVDELESLISDNEVVLARTKNVGILSDRVAVDASITGPMLRATGVRWDLRKAHPYEIYDSLHFEVPIGSNGDTFDRYFVRINEIRESIKLINQAVEQIPSGPIRTEIPYFFKPPVGTAFSSVEAPKASTPKAILRSPVVNASAASFPIIVLFAPSVIDNKELTPTPTLLASAPAPPFPANPG